MYSLSILNESYLLQSLAIYSRTTLCKISSLKSENLFLVILFSPLLVWQELHGEHGTSGGLSPTPASGYRLSDTDSCKGRAAGCSPWRTRRAHVMSGQQAAAHEGAGRQAAAGEATVWLVTAHGARMGAWADAHAAGKMPRHAPEQTIELAPSQPNTVRGGLG